MPVRHQGPELDPVAASAMTAHVADTTNVHGITDTSLLAKYSSAGIFNRTITVDMTGQTGVALSLKAGSNQSLLSLLAHGQAIGITQDQDWSNYDTNPHDAIDGYHSGTGDFIFGGHFGGVLPASFTFTATTTNGSPTLTAVSSFTGLMPGTPLSGTGIASGARVSVPNVGAATLTMSANATASGTITLTVTRPAGSTGGNAVFNALIPQFLDAPGDGRSSPTYGGILNNRVGMRGVLLDGQVSTNTEPLALIRNHQAAAAVYIENQQSGAGVNVGTGRSFQIEEYNAGASSFLMNIYNRITSTSGYAAFDARAKWANAGSSAPSNLFQAVDQNDIVRWAIDSKGAATFNDGTVNRFVIDPTASPPVSFKDATNHLRWTIDGNGAQFFYNVSGQQVGAFSGQANSDGYFIFGRNATAVIGFYGTTPIAKPTGVAVTAAGVHAALVSLGLIAA
jgi:hypothetical protein